MNDGPAEIATGIAAVGATTSIATLLSEVNTIVSILAGCVAIVAGLYAIAHYRRQAKIHRRRRS